MPRIGNGNVGSTALPSPPTLFPGRGQAEVVGEGLPLSPGRGRAGAAVEGPARLGASPTGGAPAVVEMMPGTVVRPDTGGGGHVAVSMTTGDGSFGPPTLLPQRSAADGALIDQTNHQQQPHLDALPEVAIEP